MSSKNNDGNWPAHPCEQGQTPEGTWNDTFESGLTAKQYAAIHLRVPNSGTDWLDEMIRQANHRDIAGQMSAAFMGAVSSSEVAHRHIAHHASKEGATIPEYMADLSHESAAKVISFMGNEWKPSPEGGAQ